MSTQKKKFLIQFAVCIITYLLIVYFKIFDAKIALGALIAQLIGVVIGNLIIKIFLK